MSRARGGRQEAGGEREGSESNEQRAKRQDAGTAGLPGGPSIKACRRQAARTAVTFVLSRGGSGEHKPEA